MKIEYFHSVVCGYCFIMSNRLDDVLKEFDDVELIHRAYPLNYSPNEGATENFDGHKEDAIKKWRGANTVDEAKRFNIEAFEEADFASPQSKKPMTAIRAAARAGLDYGEVFEHFQSALYEQALNIEKEDVIYDLIREMDIDFNLWKSYYNDPETVAMDQSDFQRVEDYGIEFVPAYVVDGETVIQGAKRTDLLIKLLKDTQI